MVKFFLLLEPLNQSLIILLWLYCFDCSSCIASSIYAQKCSLFLVLFFLKSKRSKTWFIALMNHALVFNYLLRFICVSWTARLSRVTSRVFFIALPSSLLLYDLLKLKFNINVLIFKLSVLGCPSLSLLTLALLVTFLCKVWGYSSYFTTT